MTRADAPASEPHFNAIASHAEALIAPETLHSLTKPPNNYPQDGPSSGALLKRLVFQMPQKQPLAHVSFHGRELALDNLHITV